MTRAYDALHWLRDLRDDELVVAEQTLPATAEAVIVGGGYMGGATALWLARAGMAAVLLERRGISTGASGRNAGFIAPGLDRPFSAAVAQLGQASALERLQYTRRGRDLALAVITELGIDCELEDCGGLTLASSDAEWQVLRDSGAALRAAGIPVETLERDDLAAHLHVPVPAVFRGALFNPETLLVSPAKINRAVIGEAERLGARVYTGTEVTALVEQPDGRLRVESSRGAILTRRVVLATNAWTPLLAGYLQGRIRPVRGQMLVTEPAPRAFRRGMSTNHGYEYWSQRHDGRIILGGARWAVPDRDEGYYAEEVNPTIQAALARFLFETFPSLAGTAIATRWAGIMGFSRDGYPFIGPLPGRPGIWVVAGFTGHGGPYSAIAGRTIAELLTRGRSDEPVHHFALDRALPEG